MMKSTHPRDPLPAISPERHRILHMASFSRSGETLMLRCLDAHPSIHVVHQIRQPEPPANKELFRLLRGRQNPSILATAVKIRAANVPSGATVFVKNATWKHPWKFDGFVLVRNPLSVVNSLILRHPETERWASRIEPSLLEQLAGKSQAEKVALVYEAKMLELATSGLPIVRYEDFVRNPEAIMTQLLALLRIPWDNMVLRSHELYPEGQTGHGKIRLWEPIYDSSLNSWKGLPRETIDSILKINARSMSAFGYDMHNGDLLLRDKLPNLIRPNHRRSLFQKLKTFVFTDSHVSKKS